MRMNEVKSQISLVKGERNECQEVTSTLYLQWQPRPHCYAMLFLGSANAKYGLWNSSARTTACGNVD